MESYDLDTDNYSIQELINFLHIQEDLSTISSTSIIKYIQHFKNDISQKSIGNQEKEIFMIFIDKAKDKLLSFVKKRPPVQLPPTNYDIIQSQNQLSGANHAVTTDKIVPVVNTFTNPFPDGVINPLEKRYFTKVICVDSIFRPNYQLSDSNNFQWALPQSEHRVVSMKLVSIELPIMWYEISETNNNNIFYIELKNMSSYSDSIQKIEIPSGNYNNTQFETTLNNLLINIGNGLEYLMVSISSITTKTIIRAKSVDDPNSISPFDITSSHYSPTFEFHLIFDKHLPKDCKIKDRDILFQKTIGWFLGFRKTNYTVSKNHKYVDSAASGGSEITYEGVIESESSYGSGRNTYIYIAVDDYNKNTLTQTISSNVGDVFIGNDILGRISIENSANEIMINQSDKIFRQRDYLGPITLRKMNIRLLNRFGDPIDINNNDFSMALELTVLY